jgi:hypothetical protein
MENQMFRLKRKAKMWRESVTAGWGHAVRSTLTLFAAVCAIVAPSLAAAADWKSLGIFPVGFGYVDTASVHKEDFPTRHGFESQMQPYLVAWLKFDTEEGVILEEIAFNCRGGYASMKLVTSLETPDSRFHSFDNSQTMRTPFQGTTVTDIAPDTAYEMAQKRICK